MKNDNIEIMNTDVTVGAEVINLSLNLAPTESAPIKMLANKDEIIKQIEAINVDNLSEPESIELSKRVKKFITALDGRRKEEKAKALAVYETLNRDIEEVKKAFEAKMASITKLLEAKEQERQATKNEQIGAILDSLTYPTDITRDHLYTRCDREKWMNKGCSLESITEQISSELKKIEMELSFDVVKKWMPVYLQNCSIADCLSAEKADSDRKEYERMQAEKAKQAEELRRTIVSAPAPVEEPAPVVVEEVIETSSEPEEGMLEYKALIKLPQSKYDALAQWIENAPAGVEISWL